MKISKSSAWLLHLIVEKGYLSSVAAMPYYHEEIYRGISKPTRATMRGLAKRGWAVELCAGVWKATDAGRAAALRIKKP